MSGDILSWHSWERRVLLSPRGQRPDTLLNIRQHTVLGSPPHQRIFHPEMSIVLNLRTPGVQIKTTICSSFKWWPLEPSTRVQEFGKFWSHDNISPKERFFEGRIGGIWSNDCIKIKIVFTFYLVCQNTPFALEEQELLTSSSSSPAWLKQQTAHQISQARLPSTGSARASKVQEGFGAGEGGGEGDCQGRFANSSQLRLPCAKLRLALTTAFLSVLLFSLVCHLSIQHH